MTTNAQGVRETAGERIEESVQGSDSPGGTVSHVCRSLAIMSA